MSMKIRDIHEGHAYVDLGGGVRLVRKILKTQIYYAYFKLPEGKCEATWNCRKPGFTNWAYRELTPQEFASLDQASLQAAVAQHDKNRRQLLSVINDYDIYLEYHERGLDQV